MSDGTKISDLPLADPLDGSEETVIVQNEATKRSSDYATTFYVNALDHTDVGADEAGTAVSAVTSHESAADPHSQYVTESDIITTVGDAKNPITDVNYTRPDVDNGLIWFIDYDALGDQVPTNMADHDVAIPVDQAE